MKRVFTIVVVILVVTFFSFVAKAMYDDYHRPLLYINGVPVTEDFTVIPLSLE